MYIKYLETVHIAVCEYRDLSLLIHYIITSYNYC